MVTSVTPGQDIWHLLLLLLLSRFSHVQLFATPGKNTEVGCHALLQGIFQTQGSHPGLLHCRQILYCLSHQGSPKYVEQIPRCDSEMSRGHPKLGLKGLKC